MSPGNFPKLSFGNATNIIPKIISIIPAKIKILPNPCILY